jgi:predicted Zn-dependent protease with MMP-like domain
LQAGEGSVYNYKSIGLLHGRHEDLSVICARDAGRKQDPNRVTYIFLYKNSLLDECEVKNNVMDINHSFIC